MTAKPKPSPKTTTQQTPVQRIAALEDEVQDLRQRVASLEATLMEMNP